MGVKNIIIVNDFAFINGGAGKVALKSAVGLKAMGYNIIVFSAVAPIEAELQKCGIEVICLYQADILNNKKRIDAVKQGLWNERAKIEFEKLLRCYNPSDTIIHFHGWTKALSCSLFSVTAKKGYHVFITLHDYFSFCPNGGVFNYQSQKICELKPLSRKCLFCNCDSRSYAQKMWRSVRQLIQNHTLYKNRKIHFIYISKLNKQVSYPYLKNLSDSWFFIQNPVEVQENKKVEIGLNHKYLFMARLSAEKGVELFCKAMTDLNLKGCVLGDGYLRKEMQKKYPNIEFAGWMSGDRKEQIIHQGKALVFPSLWYEGAPLSIIEMKAYGMPCIVPDRCAASEEVEDGTTGFIFKTGNIESLEESIKRFETADVVAMQRKILDNYNPKEYSLENHCCKLQNIYEEVLRRQSFL